MISSKRSGKAGKAKVIPLPTLVKKADKVFSTYIRNRDATTEVEDVNGCWVKAGPCITCKKVVAVTKGHCGHFVQRGCKLTRFDEQNASLQCPYCNTYRYGEQFRHGIEIDRKFGQGTTDRLVELEDKYKRDGHKFTRDELMDVIERYKI